MAMVVEKLFLTIQNGPVNANYDQFCGPFRTPILTHGHIGSQIWRKARKIVVFIACVAFFFHIANDVGRLWRKHQEIVPQHFK